MSILILNGKTSRTKPNQDLLINKHDRFEPPIINGQMPTGIAINGLYRLPVLNGCVLNLPLYHPILSASPFKSLDAYAHVCTVTGATWGSQGRIFDGTDDVINCGSAATLDALTGNMTVEAWINPTTYGEVDYGAVFSKETIRLNVRPTERASFSIWVGATEKAATTATGAVPLGAWTNLVTVFNGSNVLIYANLVLVTGSATAGPIDDHSANNFLIGDTVASNKCFNGLIGEVRIYNRALTALEIQQNYLATKWRYV